MALSTAGTKSSGKFSKTNCDSLDFQCRFIGYPMEGRRSQLCVFSWVPRPTLCFQRLLLLPGPTKPWFVNRELFKTTIATIWQEIQSQHLPPNCGLNTSKEILAYMCLLAPSVKSFLRLIFTLTYRYRTWGWQVEVWNDDQGIRSMSRQDI